MDLDEKLEGLGESITNKTSYKFVQREQLVVKNRSFYKFVPALAVIAIILVPAVILTATPLKDTFRGNAQSTTLTTNAAPEGNYPYVFQDITSLWTYGGMPPVEISLWRNAPPYFEHANSAAPDIAYNSVASLVSVSMLTTYEIIRPVVNDNYASALAKQLGFSGKAEPVASTDQRVVYSYVSESHTLEIHLNGYIDLYSNNIWDEKPSNLPSDRECIDIATKWLNEHNFYPNNVVDVTTSPIGQVATIQNGLVIDSYVTGTEVTFHVAVDGITIHNGGISIIIGDNGSILRMQTNEFTLKKAFDVPLKDSDRAYAVLKDVMTSPNPPTSNNIECIVNHRSLSSLVITSIELNYAYRSSNDYLLPVYTFTGDGYDAQNPDKVYTFVGQVDAVVH